MTIYYDVAAAVHARAGLGRYAESLGLELLAAHRDRLSLFYNVDPTIHPLPQLAGVPRRTVNAGYKRWRMQVWVGQLLRLRFDRMLPRAELYHATEHLADVAKWIHGEGTKAEKKWYKKAQKQLYQGHAQQIANELRKHASSCTDHAEDLEREANFFENNKRRMQYLELREDGFLIGSGMVESGCKQYKARFCGPGMRWSRDGIGRLIPIRSTVMGGCFDTTWQTVYNLPQN